MNKYKLSVDAFNRGHEQTISKDAIICKLVGQKQKAKNNMTDNIFENLTDEEQEHPWMYMIFNKDMIKAKTEQWTKEAEKVGMTLTEYLESISPLAEGGDKNDTN